MSHYFTNNENLKSEIRTIDYNYLDQHLSFLSDNGVFSKNKIDYGSKLLVETFLKQSNEAIENILDIGCGYGFIGVSLAKILNVRVEMVDINKRAIHLCSKNIKNNNVNAICYESDGIDNVNNKFDIIISNPPIRVGKSILLNILRTAKSKMKSNGCLWFVIRKDQGAKSIMKNLEDIYECEVIEKDKGFFIIKAKIK